MANQKEDEKTVMTSIEPPVRRALVMICEKCGKKLAPSAENNLSRELQQYLKSETKMQWGKGEVRTVVTTCMDICPDDKIAVAITHLKDKQNRRTDFFEMEPSSVITMGEQIISKLK